MPRQLETIGQHFGDAVTVEAISNGEIDTDPAIQDFDDFAMDGDWDKENELSEERLEEYKQEARDRYQEMWARIDWETITKYSREAVKGKAHLPYLGRKTCGMLMKDAMLLMRAEGAGDPPRCWYRVAKNLYASPPNFNTSRNIYVEACRELGIEYPEEVKACGHPDNYAQAWGRMASLMSGWNLTRFTNGENLAKLRDWLFEHDASEGKPAKPPWKK
jgi:hypothetical protein